jgi:hypothetical protein
MNTYLKTLLMTGVAVGLFAAETARADFRDYNYKAWAQAGRQRTSQPARRYRPMYRSTAPVIVRTESAPGAVAQAPTEERRFSYEPSQVQAGTPCPEGVVTEPAPATAERPTRTYRSFSYEPGIEPSAGPAVRTYSRPMRRDSQKPAYLLPKTDPRKYRTQ